MGSVSSGSVIRVDIWSDLVCPWCYIGKRRFEKALTAFSHRDEVTVVHRSFQLDPTVAKGQTFSHHDVLMQKYRMSESQVVAAQERVTRLAAAEGLEYHLATSRTGNTMDAHRLVHLALEQGIQDQVLERLYRAHFIENRSLFDDESLATLATDAGVKGARELLATDRYADEVVHDQRAAQASGAGGVPFFVLNQRYAVAGAQSVDVFADALTRTLAGTTEPARQGL